MQHNLEGRGERRGERREKREMCRVDMCNNVTYSTKQILVANWEDHKPSVPCLSKHFSNTMENHQARETPTSPNCNAVVKIKLLKFEILHYPAWFCKINTWHSQKMVCPCCLVQREDAIYLFMFKFYIFRDVFSFILLLFTHLHNTKRRGRRS
jgi:hypothetical protein